MDFWKIVGTVIAGLIIVFLYMVAENLATLVKVLAQIRDRLGPMQAHFDRKNQQAEEAEKDLRRREYDTFR